jgi:hypothetical protein
MRFTDFLKVNVLLSAGAATLLAAVTLIALTNSLNEVLVYVSGAWLCIATMIGLFIGRHTAVAPPIASLLRGAKSQSALPELNPGLVIINRLWLLLTATLIAAGVGIILPQVAAVAAGFCMIWALAWRHQIRAVLAIEERDGVRFYVAKASPFQPMSLIRTPWLKKLDDRRSKPHVHQ